jgi:hypothetical protein
MMKKMQPRNSQRSLAILLERNNMKKLIIQDPLDQQVMDALDKIGVEYVHETQGAALDFYLPTFDIHIECKAFHTDRINKQLRDNPNVIVIQSLKAAHAFYSLLTSGVLNK